MMTPAAQALWVAVEAVFFRLADQTQQILHETVVSAAALQRYRVDDVVEWQTEEFCCGFSIYHLDDVLGEPTLSIQFTLADATHHDDVGPHEAGWGLNILVDLIGQGGFILNSQAPYNNTRRVWTSCPDELGQRINAVDSFEIKHSAVEHLLEMQG